MYKRITALFVFSVNWLKYRIFLPAMRAVIILMVRFLRLFPERITAILRFYMVIEMRKHLSPNLPDPPIYLDEKHVKNCRIIKDRNELLKYLPANGIVAEIGVYEGTYATQIFNISKPKKLYLIDAWRNEFKIRKQVTEEKFKTQIEEEKVVVIMDYSLDALSKFEDNYFDWVYLDSDHSYDYTLKELVLLDKKVKKGGLIAGHDYTRDNWVAMMTLGVVEAVNEFCTKFEYEFVYLTIEQSMYLSFALRKIP